MDERVIKMDLQDIFQLILTVSTKWLTEYLSISLRLGLDFACKKSVSLITFRESDHVGV
jgi:hypothetical protein